MYLFTAVVGDSASTAVLKCILSKLVFSELYHNRNLMVVGYWCSLLIDGLFVHINTYYTRAVVVRFLHSAPAMCVLLVCLWMYLCFISK